MNALVKKEIRLLLPGLLIGGVLSFGNLFLQVDQFRFNALLSTITFAGCAAVAVYTALSSFGSEMSAGTFSHLLAQPISRQRIWRIKAWLLALTLFIGGLFWCMMLHLSFKEFGHPRGLGNYSDILIVTWTFLLAVYAGALWTVLLLRQMAAAFWFTILVPGALLVLLTSLWPQQYDAELMTAAVVTMQIYSVAGIWFARRLFMRAQDNAWTGGVIAMPQMSGLRRTRWRSSFKRRWRPRAALQGKEFQLHQSQFIVAGMLLILHLGVLATRKLGHFRSNSTIEFVLMAFWMLWLVMPMLTGCAAVAEERKLGIQESQFCLPIRRRTQFITKLGSIILLSLLFGVAMPLLLEGTRILPKVHLGFPVLIPRWQIQPSILHLILWNGLETLSHALPLLSLVGMAIAIGLISFYASTLARNTLQALAPAVLGLLVAFILYFMVGPGLGTDLIYLIGVPVMTITLIWLAAWNSKQLLLNWLVWIRNALVLILMLVLIAVATAAIWTRSWEKLTSFEPPHGPAKLSLAKPPKLSRDWGALSVRLPNGKMWTGNYVFNIAQANWLAFWLGNIRMINLVPGYYYPGSNWVTLSSSPWGEQAGLKTDGTLWIAKRAAHRKRSAAGRWIPVQAGNFTRVGDATNWNSLVWNVIGSNILLTKSNGTLWQWGPAHRPNFIPAVKSHIWPSFSSFTPQRIGKDTNWAKVFRIGPQVFLLKKDGRLWSTWARGGNHSQTLELAPGLTVQRAAYLEPESWRSTILCQMGLVYFLGIRNDGTFRIRADQVMQNYNNSHGARFVMKKADFQLGHSTNWVSIATGGRKIVTLKNNGTLWLWNFQYHAWSGLDAKREEGEMLRTKPFRLGTHSDWVAIANADGGIISLAADGSLWYWPLADTVYFTDEISSQFIQPNHFQTLLEISRKPQRIGNVFIKSHSSK